MPLKLIGAPLRHLALAAGHWKTFDGDRELLAGIASVDTHGHTPGHARKEPEGYAWVPAEFSPIPAVAVGK